MAKTTQKKRLAACIERARTSNRRLRRPTIQPALRGMPQPVSLDDLRLWVATICPHVAPDRWQTYAQAYDVAGKIERAKASGRWPPQPCGTL